MVKNSWSKREAKIQKVAEEEEHKKMKSALKEQDKIVKEFKSKLDDFRQTVKIEERNSDKLNKLYQMGIIDMNGDPIKHKLLLLNRGLDMAMERAVEKDRERQMEVERLAKELRVKARE